MQRALVQGCGGCGWGVVRQPLHGIGGGGGLVGNWSPSRGLSEQESIMKIKRKRFLIVGNRGSKKTGINPWG